MRIFVFEYLTGGGLLAGDGCLAGSASLAREGAAMVTALASDFAQLHGVEVVILRDPAANVPVPECVETRPVNTLCERDSAFAVEAARADATIVIAPEWDGILLDCVARVVRCGGRLLGPSTKLVALASDKHATAQHLLRAGVPAPRGTVLPSRGAWPTDLSFPMVLKPRDGAGSQDLRLLHAPPELEHWPADHDRWRIEEFRPGLAASVAVLCGPAGHVALQPCAQTLVTDGKFHYRGGALPLDKALSDRAVCLAAKTIAALPTACGYIGVDMVLGESPDGSEDAVIEINPRLTTSYVGLRAATRNNLAGVMLAVATGDRPTLTWASDRLEFTADGVVTRLAATARH